MSRFGSPNKIAEMEPPGRHVDDVVLIPPNPTDQRSHVIYVGALVGRTRGYQNDVVYMGASVGFRGIKTTSSTCGIGGRI